MEQDIDYKGYKIKIRQDESNESPNDWGTDYIFLVYDHRDFEVKRDGFEPRNIFDYLSIKKALAKEDTFQDKEELEDDLKGYFDYESEYWIFPVDAYIHSGVRISLVNANNYPDRRWDVSTTGYILASKNGLADVDGAYEAAECLIEEWNQYLSGDIWGFIIEKPQTTYSISKEKFDSLGEIPLSELVHNFDIEDEWEDVDSCWGFYGDPEESGLLAEAKSVIDNLTKNG